MAIKKHFSFCFGVFFLFLFLSLTAIFFPLLRGNFFITDDFDWITFGAQARQLSTIFAIGWGHLYDPGINVYFASVAPFFGTNPELYYAANTILHACVAFLVFLFLKKILQKTLVPFWCSLLFLFLSYGSESWFWIAAVTHLLGTGMILASLLALCRFLTTGTVFAGVCFFLLSSLALATKETALLLPILQTSILALFFFQKRTSVSRRRCVFFFALFLIVWSAYAFLQYAILSGSQTGATYIHFSLYEQMAVFLSSLPLPFFPASFFLSLPLAILFDVLLFLPLFFLRSSARILYSVGLLWAAAYVGVGSLSTVALQAGAIPHRYGYIASVGLLLCLAVLLLRMIDTQRRLGILLLLLGVPFAGAHYTALRALDTNEYDVKSIISRSLFETLPPQVAPVERLFIMDGFPYDTANPGYLGNLIWLKTGLDPKRITYVYSDNRNGKKIEREKAYAVIQYDYRGKKWKLKEKNR